jgi:molybdate transport system ATP-binding protein
VWTTTVAGIDRIGDRARVALGDPIPLTAEITMGSLVDLGLAPGDAVWVSVKATEVSTYPA